MEKQSNPFLITGYLSPKYFCDREKETSALVNAFENNRNVTLFSQRRLGKTGLIHHFFHKLNKEKKCKTIYVDILNTTDLNGFVNVLSTAALTTLETTKETFIKRLTEIFSGLRIGFKINEYTGVPEAQISLETPAEKEKSLDAVFKYLEKQKGQIAIAIDEFQQISQYEEKNIEALLRKYIQHHHHIHYVFSGSEKHLLLPMFADNSRPFYQSTQFMQLQKLKHDVYKQFIVKHFESGGVEIKEEAVEFILEWTKLHTYYTQYVCNHLYASGDTKLTLDKVKKAIPEILKERETVFFNLSKLLPFHQYQLLTAIAKENTVSEPTAQDFIKKYDLSGGSTVRKSLMGLIEKGLVNEELTEHKPEYSVNDIFLMRWMEMKQL